MIIMICILANKWDEIAFELKCDAQCSTCTSLGFIELSWWDQVMDIIMCVYISLKFVPGEQSTVILNW